MRLLLSFSALVSVSPALRSFQDNDKFAPEVVDNSVEGGFLTPQIVGGTDITYGAFPFFVQGLVCGGSLIAPDVVLTAAHCEPAFQDESSVIVGNYRYNEVTEGAEELAILSSMAVHPSYSDFANDLMMFKIEPSTLPPIRLNSNNNIPVDGQSLTVIGFGALYEGGLMTDMLQKATLQALSFEKCSTETDLAVYELDETSMLCAWVEDGSSDSCTGDSGGPLFDEATRTLVGVVSWGDGCARPNCPGVYARVSGAIDWIRQTACQLSESRLVYCDDGPPPPGADDWLPVNDDTDKPIASSGENIIRHIRILLAAACLMATSLGFLSR